MIRRSSEKRPAPATRGARPGAIRPGVRTGGGMRRTRSIRRASAGLTPIRAGALLVALVAAAALYGLASSDAFTARRMTVTGTTWTPEADVLAALAVPSDQNVFTVRTGDLAGRLALIPSIKGASVTVSLPDEVHVSVDERQALVVWKVGDRRFLVDADGLLFAELGENPPEAVAALPVIDDAQLFSIQLDVGSRLDPVVLDAALRLGSLTPADVGSAARSLTLRVDDANGFTMRTQARRTGPPSSASTRRPSAPPISSPARCGCSAACWPAARTRWTGSSSRTTTAAPTSRGPRRSRRPSPSRRRSRSRPGSRRHEGRRERGRSRCWWARVW